MNKSMELIGRIHLVHLRQSSHQKRINLCVFFMLKSRVCIMKEKN